MKKVYFDNAATTRLRSEVVARMTACLSDNYGNPSSVHGFGRTAKTLLEQARKNMAKILGIHSSELLFTSGGTEANNWILHAAVRDLKVQHIITSKIAHHAVLQAVEALAKQYPITVSYVRFSSLGVLDYQHLETLFNQSSKKTLVSLMHINNEVGTILDIPKVGKLCQDNKALFHSDMVQSVGRYVLNLSEMPVDFAVASAHKFHGPKGVGFAYIRKHSGLKPLIYGGTQERGYRAGTEGVHNIVGMEEALTMAYRYLDTDSAHITEIKRYFVARLRVEMPEITFNMNSDANLANAYTILHLTLPITPEKAAIMLLHFDLKGIACSKGSACQSGSSTPSHVLQELLENESSQQASLRFSFSRYNTKEEVDYVVTVLREFIAQ